MFYVAARTAAYGGGGARRRRRVRCSTSSSNWLKLGKPTTSARACKGGWDACIPHPLKFANATWHASSATWLCTVTPTLRWPKRLQSSTRCTVRTAHAGARYAKGSPGHHQIAQRALHATTRPFCLFWGESTGLAAERNSRFLADAQSERARSSVNALVWTGVLFGSCVRRAEANERTWAGFGRVCVGAVLYSYSCKGRGGWLVIKSNHKNSVG